MKEITKEKIYFNNLIEIKQEINKRKSIIKELENNLLIELEITIRV
jgi:hypothetical protein